MAFWIVCVPLTPWLAVIFIWHCLVRISRVRSAREKEVEDISRINDLVQAAAYRADQEQKEKIP